MIRGFLCTGAIAAVLFGATGAAVADEAKTPLSAAMILSIVAAPVDMRVSAFDESLKRAPVAAEPTEGEVMADGSVRYGRGFVTVRNPCPPGTAHWEPPPLPGRRPGR